MVILIKAFNPFFSVQHVVYFSIYEITVLCASLFSEQLIKKVDQYQLLLIFNLAFFHLKNISKKLFFY